MLGHGLLQSHLPLHLICTNGRPNKQDHNRWGTCLDVFGVVVDDDGGLEDALRQVALVLTGQVNAPLHLHGHSTLSAPSIQQAVAQADARPDWRQLDRPVCTQLGPVSYGKVIDDEDNIFETDHTSHIAAE